MNKSKWRHVPNILTILRLIAVPVMALLIISEKWTESLIIFIHAELTDILDGYIARKYNFITNFGKLADPFADKAIQLTALLLLAGDERLPYYFFFILLIKEIAMIIGSLFFLRKKIVVSSNWVGKAAAAVLFAGIVLAFLNIPAAVYFMWAGTVISIAASAIYLICYVKEVKNLSTEREEYN
jgi:cardiolipin synthase